jgi:hypothetical protein
VADADAPTSRKKALAALLYYFDPLDVLADAGGDSVRVM